MNAITVNTAECSPHSSCRAFELPARDFQDLLPAPPIDRDRLLERCLGNLDFALTLLGEFEKTSQSSLDAFAVALAEGDHVTISAKAHSLKGVAGVLSASTLMQICSNLESAAKDTDLNQTRDLTLQLNREIRRIVDFIPNIRTLA